ncbi:drug/metabolite transporter (DMT)-like permease [Herbihabitans rhizosphaerae]|uniref:Drug/metabolite transporter (DMT)-like permease n=1 Tax=Herbihabitans rhizosphaerae TaxID=1872711 RepID=A0A4Q7L6C6_9PSEU|nr:DMT family transporter [Herbihabitans rhizosphaerae]RZS44410.1 drug/metabolite transporter (DMT)-like permease [Herbihabitans rhizosphaerae]
MDTTRTAIVAGAAATAIVGASVPVTGMLDDYPVLTGQAVRYGIGGVALLAWAMVRRLPLPRPSARDLPWLLGVVVTGMLGFNACLLAAQSHADPGFVAAVLGLTPLSIALLAPLATRQKPAMAVVLGAGVVVVGIVVLSGGGAWRGPGLLLAALAMAGEASFTLLAVRPVRRLGGFAVATYGCLLATVLGFATGLAVEGPELRMPTAVEAGAIVLLGLLVTAVAFVCWYRGVDVLGADRAGVLIGLMPVSGLIVSVALGAQALTVAAVIGTVLVAIGCAVGLRSGSRQEQPAAGEPLRDNENQARNGPVTSNV